MTWISHDASVPARAAKSHAERSRSEGATVIIPCYNEEDGIADTIRAVSGVMRRSGRPYELIVVDDGSTDGTAAALSRCVREGAVRVLRNDTNCGYGHSLKRAVRQARYEIIAITDADGTYPSERIGELVDLIDRADMVVGARTGLDVNVPLLRRPAKWVLRKLAGYLTRTNIPDLNSGLRVMKRSLVGRFMSLLPDGFSFTTTITLALLTHGYRVHYVPIDYARRVGRSSIRPIRDTVNFLGLVVRTVMYFKPLQIFAPVSAALFGLAVAWALVSLLAFGKLADVSVLVIATASTQVLAIGLLADLISKRAPFEQGRSDFGRELQRASLAEKEVTGAAALDPATDLYAQSADVSLGTADSMGTL